MRQWVVPFLAISNLYPLDDLLGQLPLVASLVWLDFNTGVHASVLEVRFLLFFGGKGVECLTVDVCLSGVFGLLTPLHILVLSPILILDHLGGGIIEDHTCVFLRGMCRTEPFLPVG